MMPAVAEERRAPRIVGVEFPFGPPFGMPNERAMRPTELRFPPSVVTDTTTARSSRRAWRQSACRQTDADVDECNRAVDLVAASRPKGGWVEVPAPAADRAIFRGLLLPRGKTHR